MIKKDVLQKLDADQRRHEIGLLRALILKQPEQAKQIIDELFEAEKKSCKMREYSLI